MTFDPRKLGADCDRCPLNEKKPVGPQPSRDPKHPKLIVIGMNPGRLEENRSIPFIGPSGKMLTRALEEAGFDRADAHVTNAAYCRHDDDKELKRAIPCCAPRLARELAGFDPKIPILTLGAEAMRPTLGKAGVMKARGFVWTAPEIKPSQIRNVERRLDELRLHLLKLKKSLRLYPGIPREERLARKRRIALAASKIEPARDSVAIMKCRRVFAGRTIFPTIHPAFILQGADGWLPVLRLDIKRAVRWVNAGPGGFPLEDEGAFVQTHNAAEARRLLAKMGDLVNVDIETDGNDPMTVNLTCVGVADVRVIAKFLAGRIRKIPASAVVILDPWSPRLIATLRDALKKRTVLTHNGPAFDEIALARHGIFYGKREDTLIAHYAFASDKPKALAHVSSIYNDSSAWKTRFKQGSEEKGVAGFGVKKEDLARYNMADVKLASLAWLRMQRDLRGERAVYEHDMLHAHLCAKMQINGMLIDGPRREALSKKLKHRSAALLGEMRALLGWRNFHPSKPNDIRKALFGRLKAPTYLAPPTPTGLAAVNAVVLETLKGGHNRAAKLADFIIRWRSANDSRKEYLDNLKVDVDGRVHPHWRSYGTVNGRPATRNPNILNIIRGAYCKGCGVALLDAWGDRPAPKHGKFRKLESVWVECKKKEEAQPEDQLRDIYICPPGFIWVYFDLSQCEMRFAANLSGDPNFIKSCEGDVHAENAKVLFAGIPGALEALQDPKGAGKRFRDIAKNCGFAISYLAEADKLFNHLLEHGFDVDMDVCQDAIDRIHAAYARYYEWAYEAIDLCRKQGYLRTPFLGRKRWMGYHVKPTEVPPFLISGGVADVMNERLGIIDRRMPRQVKQIVYQYDSAIYETPIELAPAMRKLISDVWAEPVVVPNIGVRFQQPIDLKEGVRWSDFG
jgi:uracil-DNA glycosylase family 4